MPGVHRVDASFISSQEFPDFLCRAGCIDEDRTLFLKAVRDMDGMKECLIHHHYEVGIIDIGVDADPVPADPVEGRDRRAHALRAVFRKSLYEASCFERHIRQKERRCLGSLSASAMPSDLNCLFHLPLSK